MNFPVKQVTRRYAFVASLLVLLCVCVVAKAIYIMTVKKDYWMKVSQRFVRENVAVNPTRGNILADNGEVLAASLPEYQLYMDFVTGETDPKKKAKAQHERDSLVLSKADSVAEGMHKIFPDIDPAKFKAHFLEGQKRKSRYWLLYEKRISYIDYQRVLKLPLFNMSRYKSGFTAKKINMRKNPYGSLANRTIGDLYRGIDSARTGLELSFDSILRGKPGISHRQKVRGRYLTIIDKQAENGYDIQTTLNVGMQDICEKALADKLAEIEANSGVCILMEVATGDIKAMTSLTRMSDGTYKEVNADAVKNLYEPGSVFKPMSFLVGMDDGFIHMEDKVDVGCGIKEMYGAKMRDANWRSGGSGVVTVPQILQKSLNVGVSTLIDRYYHQNPKKFVEGIYRIGVAEDLKIPIPGYARPRIRMPKDDGSNWSKTALPWMSIGYETQIPPITTVNFYNGIANNGKMLRPRLVKAILRKGEVVKEFPVEVLREQMAKPEAVKNIQDCLESVVSVGLGKKAGSKYFHTSGKTGTAQVWTKNGFAAQYLVSFAGYFPSEKPLYSCIVCIQKGAPASGGGMCAPVFKRVAETVMAQRRIDDYSKARDSLHTPTPLVYAGNMESAATVLERLGISFKTTSEMSRPGACWGTCETTGRDLKLHVEPTSQAKEMPDVKGYGPRDAMFRLEKLGMKVKLRGVGCVSEQSVKAGTEIAKGQTVVLTLTNPAGKNARTAPKAEAAHNDSTDTKKQDNDSSAVKKTADKPKSEKREQQGSDSAGHKKNAHTATAKKTTDKTTAATKPTTSSAKPKTAATQSASTKKPKARKPAAKPVTAKNTSAKAGTEKKKKS